jgi:hypothetical protein
MSDGILTQTDFSGGVWEGSRVPENTAYAIVNGLLNEDDGAIRKRGGTKAYMSGTTTARILGIADVETMVGPRHLLWGEPGVLNLGVISEVSGIRAALGSSARPLPLSRPVAYRQVIILPRMSLTGRQPSMVVYAGSYKFLDYSAGTVSWPNGSSTVTGSGTSFLANVDAGMMLSGSPFLDTVIKSVDSNTQLTMVSPNNNPTASSVAYTAKAVSVTDLNFAPSVKTGSAIIVATVGSPGRLVVAWDNRVQFSQTEATNLGPIFTQTDYHELPITATVTGLQGMGWDLLVFTTAGLYVISNMAYDLTDDLGNVQHRVDLVNRDLVLLGDQGLGSWRGQTVAPCVEDVYLVGRDGSAEAISQGIRPSYRMMVKQGLIPGIAAIHRGHYFLPMIDPESYLTQDMLVCRLDGAQPAWTRWWGQAGECTALAVRQGAGARKPRLFGAASLPDTVVELTDCFDPEDSTGLDADGSAPELDIVSRKLEAAPQTAVSWLDMRLLYELSGDPDPSLLLFHQDGRSEPREGLVSAGSLSENPSAQPPRKRFRRRAQSVRFRILSSGASRKCVVRSLEVGFRRRGMS